MTFSYLPLDFLPELLDRLEEPLLFPEEEDFVEDLLRVLPLLIVVLFV